MNFELHSQSLSQLCDVSADALLLLWPDVAASGATRKPDALSAWVHAAVADKDLAEGVGKCLLGYKVPGVRSKHVVVVRSGDGSAAHTRKAVQAGVSALKPKSPHQLVVGMGDASGAAVSAAVQAVADASYVYTTTKSKSKSEPRTLRHVTVAVTGVLEGVRTAFDSAQAMVGGVELAKEWANRPGNYATPVHLADVAKALGKKPGISTEVLGPKEVAKLGMGAFLSVAAGSEQPLRFIVMHYQGAAKSSAPVVLVGKGITFDTGGISLKPGPEMDEMKYDMGGAASVLGTFAALAELQPALNVVGLIPACENMPDGRATKPGDVVTSMSGQTIEVLNTDAEGRLILCDALTYAERFKPRAVIDIATLTGACVIALGGVRAGLFASQDDLAQHLQAAGEAVLDPCWRMPLDEEYAEGLKSSFADMGNVAGRQAGSVTAAKFLQKFVNNMPWAHLDIAGVAWKSGAAKGATGRPVPLLVQYLLDEAGRLAQQAAATKPTAQVKRASKTTTPATPKAAAPSAKRKAA